MNQENGIHISFHVVQPEIQNIKYFVFKDEKYPVDFDKLKKNSKYFYRNQKQFKQIYDVSILDEADEKLITISDKAIQAFISSCQNEPAQINLSDVIPLQYLSYKYEFPNLISVTEKCIQENSDKLIFQSLLFKLSLRPNSKTFSIPTNFFNTRNEEEIISDHFNDYLKDDQMLSLPIPVLYRIFNLCHSKHERQFNENSNDVIEFLFKCLDKYGEAASILFSYVDFKKQSIGVVNRLIQNYSDKFNFNFINSTLLKTTIQLTSEVTKIKEEFSSLIYQMKQKQEEEFSKMKENEEQRRKIFEEEMANMKEEEKKREMEFFKMKEDYEKRKKLFEEEFGKMKEEVNRKQKELDDEMKRFQENEEKKRLLELQNRNVKELPYIKGNEFHGIMRYLTVKTGGNIHDNKTIEITSNFALSSPKNLVDYDNSFNNYNSGPPKSEPKICFDFKDKSIQLFNYSIQSYYRGSGHLKNWVIEVSNDGLNWTTIDQHSNDSTLNGNSITATFNINPQPTTFYRYVQLRTTGVSWYGNNRYDIFFPFIEFYGKLKKAPS